MSSIIFASTLFVTIAIALGVVFILTKFLGPNETDNKEKNTIYESGITNPVGSTKIFFSVKFYLVAILFVIFDVEVLFMLPWAVNVRELGMFGLIEMFTFIGLLFAGLIYLYRKGALKWD
jgi:NADH-quinone oxidoreductase subunit A